MRGPFVEHVLTYARGIFHVRARHFSTRVREHMFSDGTSHIFKHLHNSEHCCTLRSKDCFSILLSRSRFHHFPNKRSHSYSIGKTKFLCIVLDCHVSFYSYSLSAFCSHYTFNSVLCNLNLRWQKCLSKHLFKKCCVASQNIDKHKTMGQKLPSLLSDEIPIWRMCDFADCDSKVHTKEEYSGYNPSWHIRKGRKKGKWTRVHWRFDKEKKRERILRDQ